MKKILILFSFLIAALTVGAQHGTFTDLRLINGDSTIAGSVNGRSFYSTVSNKMRFYQNGAWNSFVKLEGSYTNPSWLVSIPGSKVTGAVFTLTTTGSSGAATYSGGTLNIPQYSGGGGSWSSILPARNGQSGTTYTLVLADKDKYVEFSNANPVTVTIPTNASVAFSNDTEISLYQYGAGLVTVAAAGGVTINTSAGVLTSPGQNTVMVLKKRATDEWYLENGTPVTTRTDVWLNNGATAFSANSSQTGSYKNTFSLDGIEITQNARSSAWLPALKVTPGANTVMTASSNTFFNFHMPAYSQEFLSGNMATKYFNYIDAPTATISGASSTYTDIYNWYYKNPVAGTGFTGTNNVWSLGAENAKFNGNILGTGTFNLTGSAPSMTITNTTANAGIFSVTPQSANGGVVIANSSATAFPGNWIETSQPFYVGATAGGTASSPNDLFRINGNAASSNFGNMSINSITASKSAAMAFTQGSGAGSAGNRNMFLGIDGNATDNYYGMNGSSNNFLFRFYNGAAFVTALTINTGSSNVAVGPTTSDNAKLYVVQPVLTASWLPTARFDPGAHTGMTTATAFPHYVWSGSTITIASGTVAVQPFAWMKANTYAGTSGTATATILTSLQIDPPVVGTNGAGDPSALYLTGKAEFDATVTAGGTTGNQTINKPTGTVNIAASGTTVTVTNSLCTTTSIVYAVIRTNDTTAAIKNIVPSAGSFVITLSAAATAEISIGFVVFN